MGNLVAGKFVHHREVYRLFKAFNSLEGFCPHHQAGGLIAGIGNRQQQDVIPDFGGGKVNVQAGEVFVRIVGRRIHHQLFAGDYLIDGIPNFGLGARRSIPVVLAYIQRHGSRTQHSAEHPHIQLVIHKLAPLGTGGTNVNLSIFAVVDCNLVVFKGTTIELAFLCSQLAVFKGRVAHIGKSAFTCYAIQNGAALQGALHLNAFIIHTLYHLDAAAHATAIHYHILQHKIGRGQGCRNDKAIGLLGVACEYSGVLRVLAANDHIFALCIQIHGILATLQQNQGGFRGNLQLIQNLLQGIRTCFNGLYSIGVCNGKGIANTNYRGSFAGIAAEGIVFAGDVQLNGCVHITFAGFAAGNQLNTIAVAIRVGVPIALEDRVLFIGVGNFLFNAQNLLVGGGVGNTFYQLCGKAKARANVTTRAFVLFCNVGIACQVQLKAAFFHHTIQPHSIPITQVFQVLGQIDALVIGTIVFIGSQGIVGTPLRKPVELIQNFAHRGTAAQLHKSFSRCVFAG